MEFVTTREDFLAMLQHAARHADAKSAMPVLCSVALYATADGVLRVEATDLIRTFRGKMRVEVKRGGDVLLDARALAQTVGGFPEKAEITVTVEKNFTTKLVAKKIRATLAGQSAEDMPTIPDVRGEAASIAAPALARAIATVRPFVAEDQTRPYLNAALFSGAEVVTTNGHALGYLPLPARVAKVLVPAEALDTWRAALRDIEGDVVLRAESSTSPVALETPAGIFTTKTVDAAFPSWEQVVPTDFPWAIEVDAGEVRAITRRMPVASRTCLVKLLVERDGMLDELVIHGENPDAACSKEARVGCKVLRGRDRIPSCWGMSLTYLLDAIAPAEGVVVIEGDGALDPFKFSAPGVEGYFAVVMPGRV